MWSVWDVIRQLESRIRALEIENIELRRVVQEVQAKSKRPLRVKKLVYHVHTLHIEEMSGTLNIGLNGSLQEEEMEEIELEMHNQQD
ncbi:spore germination protein GerPC [Tumebacillus permanentifrigoris]|uniref:Spore germination protein GerPC n=1 Tax=Tumebacillus permanentifrigoris TaxID=378543 RepID=A0A316D6L9_9BACL|nr:spore germination protein GerPC [Tumebacillus permanentifrigoris]PWK08481.1 spore germination protein GerPC [Tumebacillus permanentifrigoris]